LVLLNTLLLFLFEFGNLFAYHSSQFEIQSSSMVCYNEFCISVLLHIKSNDSDH